MLTIAAFITGFVISWFALDTVKERSTMNMTFEKFAQATVLTCISVLFVLVFAAVIPLMVNVVIDSWSTLLSR